MKYLSPEIEAWSKDSNMKSLVSPGVSCGIFQDCNAKEDRLVYIQQHIAKTKNL